MVNDNGVIIITLIRVIMMTPIIMITLICMLIITNMMMMIKIVITITTPVHALSPCLPANQRVLLDYESAGLKDQVPDGMTIDVDGNLWVACFGGSQVEASLSIQGGSTSFHFFVVLVIILSIF